MNMAISTITGTAVAAAPSDLLTAEPVAIEDPIFAVIEQHRQAHQAHKEAHAHYFQLREQEEAKRDPKGVYLGEFPETKWIVEEIDGKRDIENAVEVPTGRIVSFFATIPPDIADIAKRHGCTGAWKTEKLREWEQWSKINDQDSPRSQAYDAWNDAIEVLANATAALKTRPATLAGVAALLRHVAETYSSAGDSTWATVSLLAADYGDSDEPTSDDDDLLHNNVDEDDDLDESTLDDDDLLRDILKTLADAVEAQS